VYRPTKKTRRNQRIPGAELRGGQEATGVSYILYAETADGSSYMLAGGMDEATSLTFADETALWFNKPADSKGVPVLVPRT
jgi:hypothetical protein